MAKLTPLIEQSARDTAEERGIQIPTDFGPNTPLFGRNGVFDSMGLVSLVVAVEERIEEEYGFLIALADERAMLQEKSPFLNVSSLAEYAERALDEVE